MNQFILEDGKGKMFSEDGNEVSVLQMEVDDPSFPLGDVTSFNEYLDLKPPEKPKDERKEATNSKVKSDNLSENDASTLRTHRKYKKEDMEHFFFLVNEKGMSVRGAAKHLKIPSSTAFNWQKKKH
ncbi:hypothetical protein G6F43_006405 [Rhizopus delemar]|nr:hypothetical protein G6F43_006405 [Rhizopus delemar]